MTKKFSMKLTQDAHQVVAKFKATADRNGVHLVGDDSLGKFKGMGIEGNYQISGDELNITIVKKPMLLGWSLIEAKLRDFIVT